MLLVREVNERTGFGLDFRQELVTNGISTSLIPPGLAGIKAATMCQAPLAALCIKY